MNQKQINMIFKVLIDKEDSENPFRNTLAKINKVGKYRLRAADLEDIEGYTYMLITECLTNISMRYWNDMSDSEKEEDLIRHCINEFQKLSYNEGINSGTYFDKTNKTYSRLNHLNIDEPNLRENLSDGSINDEPQLNFTLTKYIFNNYVNESYLTRSQLRFIDTFINNYVDESGNICDMETNEILYTKQNVNYHKKGIYNRLIIPIENDENIDISGSRWILI